MGYFDEDGGYCVLCGALMKHDKDIFEHYDDCHTHHCEHCDETFETQEDLRSHHEDEHHYCKPCNRLFKCWSNLDSHLRSSIHTPATYKCPMKTCKKGYVSAAAVVLHLESGNCVSGVTRTLIDRYMIEHDVSNIMTKPSRLIKGATNSPAPPLTITTYIATEASFNGRGYECYFCHKTFSHLPQLNQHLASPKHTHPDERIYRCPNHKCGERRSTLSALCQHIESGSCGVNKFSHVTDAMDEFVSGMKRLRMS